MKGKISDICKDSNGFLYVVWNCAIDLLHSEREESSLCRFLQACLLLIFIFFPWGMSQSELSAGTQS